jgi:hypothetical protein
MSVNANMKVRDGLGFLLGKLRGSDGPSKYQDLLLEDAW